jgi:hypothetical protein
MSTSGGLTPTEADQYNAYPISTASTFTIYSGACHMANLIIGNTVAGNTINFYDNTTATGTPVLVIDTVKDTIHQFNVMIKLSVGLTVDTSGITLPFDMTVFWRPVYF